ncbi:MAG: hypothetical protein JXR39_07730 [Marinilabiliaceae bacterium]|nr:hypothetical protein [Marinilabiliaceae bacterium]
MVDLSEYLYPAQLFIMHRTVIDILQHMAIAQQSSEQPGMIPGWRSHGLMGWTRRERTLFFSSAVAFVLKSHLQIMDGDERACAEGIIREANAHYGRFWNVSRPSVNFWSRRPREWFPGGRLLHRFRFFDLPDDVDSTAMVMLTAGTDTANVQQFHDLLPCHANTVRLCLRNGCEAYRHMPFYSTWLGEKMPIEMDVCVLTNLMLLFWKSGVALNQHDAATRELLHLVVGSGKIVCDAFRLSPEYPRAALIYYHLSRLAALVPFFFEADAMQQLRAQVLHASCSSGTMDDLLLDNARLLLGVDPASIMTVPGRPGRRDYWFTAGFLSVYAHPLLQRLAPLALFHYRYHCPAFIDALVVENLLLRRQAGMSF